MSVRVLFLSSLLVAAGAAASAEKVTLPTGTKIEARTDRELRSDSLAEGDTFECTVTAPVLGLGTSAFAPEYGNMVRATSRIVRPRPFTRPTPGTLGMGIRGPP